MNKEYLEDYEQREKAEYKRLESRILDGKFSFQEDRFPPDSRFVHIQKPVAHAEVEATSNSSDLWAQVPFSGSLLLSLPPFPQFIFERVLFKVAEIPRIIDFIKDTGKLQVAINSPPTRYEGLDYLDPFFVELDPPCFHAAPLSLFGNKREIVQIRSDFDSFGKQGLIDFIRKEAQACGLNFEQYLTLIKAPYLFLKLGHYAIVEEIETLMISNPRQAVAILSAYLDFVVSPIIDLRSDLRNLSTRTIGTARLLPLVYQPSEIRFPCEIGKFLFKKLACAPNDMRSCYYMIDHYDRYDLQRIQKSLNEAILSNHQDIVSKSAEELSAILDDVWNDRTISKRMENMSIALPISVAAIGAAAGGLTGGLAGVRTGGFLAELGFKVAEKAVDKFFSVKGQGLSEKLAKLGTKSYQANIYDFKKKYRGKIAHP